MTCETDIKHNAIVKETASDVLGSSSSCGRRNAQSELNICGSQMLPGQKRVPKIACFAEDPVAFVIDRLEWVESTRILAGSTSSCLQPSLSSFEKGQQSIRR
ncbi:hypothetical protein Tco_0694914 [Tanacetum coccineum]